MENKLIRKQIRKISNTTALPLLIYILFSNVIIYGTSMFISAFKSKFPLLEDTGFQQLLLYSEIYLVLMPVILLIFYKTRGKKVNLSFSSSFAKPQKSAGWCFMWIIIAMGFTYLASYISNFISTLFELSSGIDLYEPSMSFGTSIFGILVTLIAPPIFAPFMEEFIFRGLVYRNTEPVGQWFAIIISGLIFGLWHQNYAQFLFTCVMGMFSAFLLAKTRSVIPSIILHFAINTISTTTTIILMNLGISDISNLTNEMLFENPIALLVIGFMGLFIISLIIASVILLIIQLIKFNGKPHLNSGYYKTSTSNKIAAYFSSPLMIAVLLIFVLLTVFNAIP